MTPTANDIIGNQVLAHALTQARDSIEAPGRWCAGAKAQDAGGDELFHANDPHACRWSAFGAIYKASLDIAGYDGTGAGLLRQAMVFALGDVLAERGYTLSPTNAYSAWRSDRARLDHTRRLIEDINDKPDGAGHDIMLRAFDRAIDRAHDRAGDAMAHARGEY